VYDYRQNQLRDPKNDFNMTTALGVTAAIAAAAAGGFGLSRLLKRAPRVVTKEYAPESSAVRQYAPASPEVRQAKAYSKTTPDVAPSKVVEQPPVVTEITAKPARDRAQELVDEYLGDIDLEQQGFAPQTKTEQMQQLAELNRQHGIVRRAIESKGKKILTEIQNEAKPFNLSYIESTGAKAPDLTSVQQSEAPQLAAQQRAAFESGEDQVTGRYKHMLQLNEDLDTSQIDVMEAIAEHQYRVGMEQEPPGFAAFSRDAERIASTSNQIQSSPQNLSPVNNVNREVIQTNNPFDMTEEEFETMGEYGTKVLGEIYERGGRSVTDLTGEVEINPRAARQLRKEGGIQVRRGNTIPLSQFSDTPARERIGVNRFTPDEILERTMAAASYPRHIRDQILNPNVSREEIREFLGTTPQIRGGAVSNNPTMEIAGGARASMPDALVEELQTAGVGGIGLTHAYTDDLSLLGQKEKLERAGFTFDPNTGNWVQEIDDVTHTAAIDDGYTFDEHATDYGDTEGVGNLLISTETFNEKTNKGKTLVPGSIEYMRGARSGSERQERVYDTVLPFRRNSEGEETTGLLVQANPELSFGRQLRSRDVGRRTPMGISSEDVSTQGSKLIGGVQGTVNTVSRFITTQPTSDYTNTFKKVPYIKGGLMYGVDGRPYVPQTRLLTGEEEPLVGKKRTPLKGEPGWTTHPSAPLEPLALERAELEQVAQDAKNAYFNNPSVKAGYLQRNKPELLAAGREAGKTLDEIGEAFDYQGFIIEAVNNYLMEEKGIDLPLLKLKENEKIGSSYYSTEAHAFVTNLLKTEKHTPIYGTPVKTDQAGNPLIKGFKTGTDRRTGRTFTTKYPDYALESEEQIPIPGRHQVKGSGGVDPMTVDDEGYSNDVAYFAPRIEPSHNRRTLQELKRLGVDAGTVLGVPRSTPTGEAMSMMREAMETPKTGVGTRNVPTFDPITGRLLGKTNISTLNIGSFARTQNPYTGNAAAAMGPASLASTGNYQHLERDLQAKLAPVAQVPLAGISSATRVTPAQLDQLNQFALTANLTPGGYVRQGALRLNKGNELAARRQAEAVYPLIKLTSNDALVRQQEMAKLQTALAGNLDAPILSGVGPLSEGETIQRYGMTGSNLAQFGNALMRQAALDKMIVTPEGRRGKPPGPTSFRTQGQDPRNNQVVNVSFLSQGDRGARIEDLIGYLLTPKSRETGSRPQFLPRPQSRRNK
jgi:hypothetical protein